MTKKFAILFLTFVMVFCCAYKKPNKFVIEAEKDAFWHNNVGINYRKDRIYYAAIQEFKIAISLSPSTQASAVFHNNLGETYLFINYPEAAKTCFEDAVKLYGLNLKYHINLVKTYVQLGQTEAKIKESETLRRAWLSPFITLKSVFLIYLSKISSLKFGACEMQNCNSGCRF